MNNTIEGRAADLHLGERQDERGEDESAGAVGDLVEESRETISHLQEEVRDVGDEAERANRELSLQIADLLSRLERNEATLLTLSDEKTDLHPDRRETKETKQKAAFVHPNALKKRRRQEFLI